ncbi:hypothetical protein GLS40_07430 [Pseudooceanicola sp. 216_PA32_1]|uniref:YMGG-like Gly-zipper domain-containing protein n=1 Tax=Pseudooceanicola pacificus TaxID=2676438 RepID=A0A844WDP0_9RHOB|nr:hypothetical protein [Pseudooceanicola pacificus]MWB77850.1 hypothetical protein [Pseudooceanicola pacificus]
MGFRKLLLLGGICAGLSACGDTFGNQALVGAGAGAVGGAVLGEGTRGLAAGAVIGATANVAYCRQFPHRCG